MNMQGVEDIHLHEKGCGVWYEEDCDCVHSYDPDTLREDTQSLIDKWAKEDQDSWMYEEPPVRRSKSAKPKMGVSGRSIFTILREIGRRGKK